MHWFQQSLQRRILAALTFVVLFAIVTLGILAYMTQREVLEEQFSAQLNAAADSKQMQISAWLAERKSDVLYLTQSSVTRRYLEKLIAADSTPNEKQVADEILQEALASMQHSRGDYNRILLADPTGHILISPETELVGRQIANQAALDGTLAFGLTSPNDVYLQRIDYNASTGRYEMCFGHVLRALASDDVDAPILGLLLITADMGQSVYKFLEEWPMGQSGTAVLGLAEVDGTRILNQVRYDEAKPLERLLPLEDPSIAKPAQLAARGGEGTKLAVDHLGQSVITVYRHLPELQWGLVLKMNTSEIFAPLRALIAQVLLLAVGVLLLTTLLAFPIANTLIEPIRQLVHATHAVAEGDLAISVPAGRQDEIGLLARSFGNMVENVKRHQQQLLAVNQIASGILGERPCDEALYELVQAACQLTNAEGAAIILDEYDCRSGQEWLNHSEHAAEATAILKVEGATALYTARNGHATAIDIHSLLTTTPDDSPDVITAPVWGQDRQLGTLFLYKRTSADTLGPSGGHGQTPDTQPSALSLSDRDTLHALANYAAVVLENARLVTELRQWNSQLEDRVVERTHEVENVNKLLTQLDEMKTEFIYNVSHELRNPITNLKLQSDLLRKNIDSSRRERYVTSIARQVDIMAQLVADMLDLIQLDRMHTQVEFSRVDLNQIVREVVQKQSAKCHEQSIRLELELTNGPLFIDGEQVQLRRAIHHLLRNAISYSTAGTIRVCTAACEEYLCLQVQDTGIGIAEADLPHIFQRFFRGANVSQSTIPGSGLGLSLVQEVANLHQGKLTVESKLQHGSTFRLLLPATESVAAPLMVAH